MNNRNNIPQNQGVPPRNNKAAVLGAAIVIFGLFLLLKNLGTGWFLPDWLFGWQMILIIVGTVIGVNSRFEKKSSIILIAIGAIFLMKDIFGGFNPMKVIIPAVAIIVGIYMINRNRRTYQPPTTPETPSPTPTHPTDEFDWDKRVTHTENIDQTNTDTANAQSQYQIPLDASENYINIDSVCGAANKIILSKNFLGGNITNVFGNSKINLLQADIQQPIVIDVFQLFGSTKIVVPPHWTITHNVSSIFGEIDDRRTIINHPYDENKKVYIIGTSIFSTLTIKNS